MHCSFPKTVEELLLHAREYSREKANPEVDIPVPEALLAYFADLPKELRDYIVDQWRRAIASGKGYAVVHAHTGWKIVGQRAWRKLLEAVDSCPFIQRTRSYQVGVRSKRWIFDLKALGKTISDYAQKAQLIDGGLCRVGPLASRLAWASAAALGSACLWVPRADWLRSACSEAFAWLRAASSRAGCEPPSLRLVDSEVVRGASPSVIGVGSVAPAFSRFEDCWWYSPIVDCIRSLVLPSVGWDEYSASATCDDVDAGWKSLLDCLARASRLFYRRNRRLKVHDRQEIFVTRDVYGEGRLYHPLISLPKRYRRRIKFLGGEPGAEVDMGSTYWALIAGRVKDGPSRDRLIELLQGNCFYETLNAELPEPFTDRRKLKGRVQRDCLFGCCCDLWKDNHLWAALRRLLPDVAELLVLWRKKISRTHLAYKLNRLEARIFIDDVFRHLTLAGEKVLPFHDGMIVRESIAQDVKRVVELFAQKHLGFVPSVSIKYYRELANA